MFKRELILQLILARLVKEGYVIPKKSKSMITFFEGMIPSELSQVFLAFSLWKTASYLENPQTYASATGLSVLLLSFISDYYLAKMFAQNLKASDEFKAALQAAGIQPNPSEHFSYRRWLPSNDVESIRHIKYYKDHEPGQGQFYRLNIIRKKNGDPKAPVFMYIHGGGWVIGDKNFHSLPLLYFLAAKGWIVYTVNYRLAPNSPYPAHLLDCKLALRWIRETGIPTYGGNSDLVVVGGESAGGHLALMMALTQNDKQYQPRFEHVSMAVAGCVDLYGVHDLRDEKEHFRKMDNGGLEKFLRHTVLQKSKKREYHLYENASPVFLVKKLKSEEIPPIIGIHGDRDSLVPLNDAIDFYDELQKKRKEAGHENKDVFCKVTGAHHAFNFLPSPRTLAAGDTVYSFLRHLKTKSKL